MKEIQAIEERRTEILREMGMIRSLRRGSITEQHLRVRRQGKKEAVLRGPYYVFSRQEGGKTKSRRLTSAEATAQARREVAAHHHFRKLCREFEELTERLGELCRAAEGEGPEKKRQRSRSSGMRR